MEIALLQQITDRLTEMFGEDPSSPCVTTSKLPNGRYYVSLCRFHERMGQQREVIAKTQADTLLEAFATLVVALGGEVQQ